ncbi:uncharacterized protein G2W53_003933 [Senna tora]|uniref:Secreted protein n=1 Tax=Senna tora TaxID=362788 RepID=A0A835CIV3_9FABA|nr:uncharacterized protein G2W53_003933 [Senna tora]
MVTVLLSFLFSIFFPPHHSQPSAASRLTHIPLSFLSTSLTIREHIYGGEFGGGRSMSCVKTDLRAWWRRRRAATAVVAMDDGSKMCVALSNGSICTAHHRLALKQAGPF